MIWLGENGHSSCLAVFIVNQEDRISIKNKIIIINKLYYNMIKSFLREVQ